MEQLTEENELEKIADKTSYSGDNTVDSWREFYYDLGKRYVAGEVLKRPSWLKTRKIGFFPSEKIKRNVKKYVMETTEDFLCWLEDSGFPKGLETTLEPPIRYKDFLSVSENLEREEAYMMIESNSRLWGGEAHFEVGRGLMYIPFSTYNKPKIRFLSLHELSELLTPVGFLHHEEHVEIDEYESDGFCILSYKDELMNLSEKDQRENLRLCDQCLDGMNHFWRGIIENSRHR